MPAASWRRPEAETKARSTRRRRYGLLGASGWCSTGAAELQEQRAHDQFAGAGRKRPYSRRRRRNELGGEWRLRARESERGEMGGVDGFIKPRRCFRSCQGGARWRGYARARMRGDSATRPQRREEDGGADRWGPPVSGSGEAARSLPSAGGTLNPTADAQIQRPKRIRVMSYDLNWILS